MIYNIQKGKFQTYLKKDKATEKNTLDFSSPLRWSTEDIKIDKDPLETVQNLGILESEPEIIPKQMSVLNVLIHNKLEKGLFAGEQINKGEVFHVCKGELVPFESIQLGFVPEKYSTTTGIFARFGKQIKLSVLDQICIKETGKPASQHLFQVHLVLEDHSKFINHSQDPNVKLFSYLKKDRNGQLGLVVCLKAIKEIKQNNQLFLKYSYPDDYFIELK